MTNNEEGLEDIFMGGDDDDADISNSISQLLGVLDDSEKTELFSELSMREIRHLAVMVELGDDLLGGIAHEYMTLKVSHRRRGRGEITDIAEALSGIMSRETTEQSLRERILG